MRQKHNPAPTSPQEEEVRNYGRIADYTRSGKDNRSGQNENLDYVENSPPSRTGGTLQPSAMGERNLNQLAENLDLSPEEGARALKEFAKAKREKASRAATAPHLEAATTEAATPKASNGLEWPTEKWKGSPEELSRKRYQIIAFLRRVWRPFINENDVIVTKTILRSKDFPAGKALDSYLHSHDMPSDIRIIDDQQLKEYLTQRPVKLVAVSMH